jgi:hypothetical protein
MATRETAAADSNVSGQRRCDRETAMVLRGRDGETRVGSKQIQRGCHRAMETRATVIKAGQRRHKWAMVQAKGRRDTSGEQTNSKGTQAGNEDACNSD